MDRQTDVRHINLIGGLVASEPPKNTHKSQTKLMKAEKLDANFEAPFSV